MRFWGMAAALMLLTGVGLGAFGAHGLQKARGADLLAVFETGVRYQLVHGLALLAVAILVERLPGVQAAGWAYLLGIVVFSGSLYLLVATGVRTWGAVTPVGGLALLAGHGLLLAAFWRAG